MPKYVSTIITPDGSIYAIRPTLETLATIGITPDSSGDYLPLAGGSMSGNISMSRLYTIRDVASAVQDTDVARFDQVLQYNELDDAYTAKSLRITNVHNPVNNGDAVNLKYMSTYVDTAIAPKFNSTDVSITNINGQNDFNTAYVFYDQRAASYPALAFGGGLMNINTVCHIFVYYCGAAANPGNYSGSGYFGIPNDIIVGNHASGNNNHVWINGKKVNGGSISGSGNVTYFQTPSPGGIVEISVAYNNYERQYRTFIKVDAPETSI